MGQGGPEIGPRRMQIRLSPIAPTVNRAHGHCRIRVGSTVLKTKISVLKTEHGLHGHTSQNTNVHSSVMLVLLLMLLSLMPVDLRAETRCGRRL